MTDTFEEAVSIFDIESAELDGGADSGQTNDLPTRADRRDKMTEHHRGRVALEDDLAIDFEAQTSGVGYRLQWLAVLMWLPLAFGLALLAALA